MIKKYKIVAWILFILSAISYAGLTYIVLENKLLPPRYRLAFISILLILNLIVFLLITIFDRKKGVLIGSSIFLVFLIIVQAAAFLYIDKALSTADDIGNTEDDHVFTFSIIVKEDSPFLGISDIEGKEVSAALERDGEHIDQFLGDFKEQFGFNVDLKDDGTYIHMAKDLLDDDIEVMLLNETYRDMIEEQFDDFSSQTRVLQPIEIKVDKETQETQEIAMEDSFTVYISGIDQSGSLSSMGRSDVNIIANINPNTKKILLTTTSRDAYVPIAGRGNDQNDKLTHSGIYGIDSSIETLENLYNIDIDYYARVNFTSLINMVDALGGVTIDSPVTFTSSVSGHYFEKGKNYVNGEEALAFSRERYKMPNGDVDRGRNQMQVITAMIEKALSPAILVRYNSVLDVLLDSVQTNMPTSKMIEIINGQIDHGGIWDMETQEVKGREAYGLPSYAMPGYDLYMYDLDEDSVNEVSRHMKEVLNEEPVDANLKKDLPSGKVFYALCHICLY